MSLRAKLPPYEMTRLGHPLTPPDTDADYPPNLNASGSTPLGLGIDMEPAQTYVAPSATEVPLHHPPRKPSISYIHSGPRESRERVIQRGMRWLVVVIPPPSFAQEHGHLGHTLSSGPTTRLPQGILMPLHPTMNAQLTAIAREFSFPSTSGLCLYLHTVQAGVSVTPRISEESWPLLWGHLFDPRTPSLPPTQIPIGGRIELDIDFRKARWYEAWISFPRREAELAGSVAPSRPPSVSHFRGDSRTSIVEDQVDDQSETISQIQYARNRMLSRHVPRKLSLLDRFDAASVKSGSRLVPRNVSPPSPTQQHPTHALSPIVQEVSPLHDRKHLDELVSSWRVGASKAAPSPLATTGQTSLDPVNLPNNFPLMDTPEDLDVQSELNLEDFTWSVSSVGPPDYDSDLESFVSWERVPSVHLDRRLEGSVLLTPTTCTSFGPMSYDLEYSPISNIDRLPSPDLAGRMLEDCPPTPSTCTSWGPPSEYPDSPLDQYAYCRAPSIDMGHRGAYSRPATPSTATSWGPPSEYPESPLHHGYRYWRAPSVDLGHRGEYSRPATPSTATSWGPPESYPPSPISPFYVRTPDAGERTFEIEYPRPTFPRGQPWHHLWPYNAGNRSSSETVGYPHFDLYPAVGIAASTTLQGAPWRLIWQYNAHIDEARRTSSSSDSQEAAPWKLVWPYNARKARRDSLNNSLGAYPYLNIYPAVYPSFDIYPHAAGVVSDNVKDVSVRLESSYPALIIYRPVYPHLDIYPSVSTFTRQTRCEQQQSPSKSLPVTLPSQYPAFDIYPAVYPWSLESVYPSIEAEASSHDVSLSLPSVYPVLAIYAPVYPYSVYEIYPAIRPSPVEQVASNSSGLIVKLNTRYPNMTIYPAVYPYNLDTIYPSLLGNTASCEAVVVELPATYPALNIYPGVYPNNLLEIYPSRETAIVAPLSRSPASRRPTISVTVAGLPSRYAAEPQRAKRDHSILSASPLSSASRRLAPPVPPLPQNVQRLRPISPLSSLPIADRKALSLPVYLTATYPAILPYPPVYPYFSIYPEAAGASFAYKNGPVVIHLESKYPVLNIYPAQYPFLDIYPSISANIEERPTHAFDSSSSEPTRYRPKRTHADLHMQVFEYIAPRSTSATRYRPKHTHLELHMQVFGENVASSSTNDAEVRRPRHTHLELHRQVFAKNLPPQPAPPSRQLPPAPLSPPTQALPPRGAPAGPPPAGALPAVPGPHLLRRSRSGTVSQRPALPTPPSGDSSSKTPRQLPPVPGEGSGSPPRAVFPRTSGLPQSVNLRPTGLRPTSSFSPLPSVPEPGTAPASLSLRPVGSRMSYVPAGPGSAPVQSAANYRLSLRPVAQSPSNTGSAEIVRSRTLPPRPLPRARRDSVVDPVDPAVDPPPLNITMSSLAQFPAPPRPPLPTTPAVRRQSSIEQPR